MWNVTAEQVDFKDGVAHNLSGEDQLTLAEICASAEKTGGQISGRANINARGAGPSFAVHICDIKVDKETGKTDVVRYTAIQDAGKAIHPSYVEGQFQGGAVQGIGWALNEEYVYSKDGIMENAGFLDYRIPLASDLPEIETFLKDQVPEVSVVVAHGQMAAGELEEVMAAFVAGEHDVLVCTTIIETGIDIPSANTIVIDRADKFGLAQLHQLRGRVGRSHHQAYAYLLLPTQTKLSPDAQKRIDAIQAASDLGAGFTLASHDLEIRGAGELLGDEQSGHLQKIGFTLFTEMLEEAVAAIKDGRAPSIDLETIKAVDINLRIPALIPDDYLPDVHIRLIMYKRISACKDADELRELQVEMIDRFGMLPKPLQLLFRVTQLKLAAQGFGISKIDANAVSGRFEFRPDTKVDGLSLIELVQQQPQLFKFSGPNQLNFTHNAEQPDDKLDFIDAVLARLRIDA